MKITAGPYLQDVAADGITVMWHTDEPSSSIVEYEANPEGVGFNHYRGGPSTPEYREHVEDDRRVCVHAVRLEGLRKCWEYFYRVRSEANGDSVRSEGASFRTAPGDDAPFRFGTYGDSMVVADIHARIAGLARSYRPDIMVGSGDLVLDRIERCHDDFFEPAAKLLRYTPWYATMGNHDSNTEVHTQFFAYPEPRWWYSFNYGCARFTVLNSNSDYGPDSEQQAWLRADLERCRGARWKFVFFHHPPHASDHCQIEAMRVLCPLFEDAGVDIVYNAHPTHYERFHPLRDGAVHADGVVYLLTGGGGCPPDASYAQLWDHLHPTSAMARTGNFFVLSHVAPDEVTIRAIDAEDRVFDQFTIRKPPAPLPALPPRASLPPVMPLAADAVAAGQVEGAARWVLPRPWFTCDPNATSTPIRWQEEADSVTCPANRRLLVDDGPVGSLTAGKRYSLSAQVRTEGVEGSVSVALEWNSDAGFLGRVSSASLDGTRDWTELRLESPPLPASLYALRVLLTASPGSRGTAWFDQVTLEELPP